MTENCAPSVWLESPKGEQVPVRVRQSVNERKHMKKLLAIATLLFAAFPLAARAQTTNYWPLLPQTKLEGFETNTGTLILKATAPIGTVAASTGELSVMCREVTDLGTRRREFGLVIAFAENSRADEMCLIDYDELDSLQDGLDYLNKVDWSVTPLPSFDAVYTTKGGFRIAAYGDRRRGGIGFAARNVRLLAPALQLSHSQLGQLRSVLDEARNKLDSLRKGK
jgi:hypothetical protein